MGGYNKFKIHGRNSSKKGDDSFLDQTNTTVELNISRDNARGTSPMRTTAKGRNLSQDHQDPSRREEGKRGFDHGSLVNYVNRESSVEAKPKKRYNIAVGIGNQGHHDLTREKKVHNRPLNVVLGNNVAHHLQNNRNRKKNH